MQLNTNGSFADVATESGERQAMNLDIELISDIRAGLPAIRRRSVRYLPQYPAESNDEYRRRVATAPWRPEFVDSLRALASKPFASDVTTAEDTPPDLAVLAEDIDGRGNSLTVFARHAFTEGLAYGVHAILADYPAMPTNASRADEKASGARPYWVHVPVETIIALRAEVVNGREIVTHLRIRQNSIEPDGFGEKAVERIRVIEPGYWQLWEKNVAGAWVLASTGEIRWNGKLTEEVPVVLFFTGQRTGALQTIPPLRDLGEVQIELYRALSRQDEILTYAGSPMLAAIGMTAPGPGDNPQISVGPKTVLFSPGGSESSRWEYVSPDAAAIAEIRLQIDSIIQNMHRLGMQPLVPLTGSPTATASAINAAKAHSSLSAWANGLKDALERAFQFTAKYMGIDHTTVVEVFTDFEAGDANTVEAEIILQAEAASVISKRTTREELSRRNILGPQYDPAQEARRLASERRSAAPAVTAPKIPEPDVRIPEPLTTPD